MFFLLAFQHPEKSSFHPCLRRAHNCDDLFSISSLPCGGQTEQNVPCMKEFASMLAALAVLSAPLALAEDFKTTNVKEYKDATITRVEADGIVLRTKTGISKVYFIELPKEVQERFHYGQAKPIATQPEREPVKLETKKDGRRQSD